MEVTYRQIQQEVRRRESLGVQTCWIADVKNSLGIATRQAWNRQGDGRVKPCPPEKRNAIIQAMKRLGAI